MPKKKIFKKQRTSYSDMPVFKLKKIGKLSEFQATKRVRDKKYISKALWECLKTDDPEGFKEILKAHLELRNKEDIQKKTGISRRTLYRMLSKKGNPTLQNISRIVYKLCA